jgi:hypothetical protein
MNGGALKYQQRNLNSKDYVFLLILQGNFIYLVVALLMLTEILILHVTGLRCVSSTPE